MRMKRIMVGKKDCGILLCNKQVKIFIWLDMDLVIVLRRFIIVYIFDGVKLNMDFKCL